MTPIPSHPRHLLSEVIHQTVRFSIVAALASADSLDFATIRDAIQVSDSVLSKQITILEQAEILEVKKGYVGKRPRTWVKLTPDGREAWVNHLDVLRQIAGGTSATQN
ncbi:transcriptional regulator [Subtercola sp. RTI3]|uniref:winged helix-turn-helix domain-containing protein n=1 Tax=Subtercola sp. RTI3 TaxID=3048639 RepID=UPI002B239ED3|nr:transcriptional regulator [Subtercola sp. RTI3]MEA9987243.1 transcriptional regulator [Subtercola sp. RTI3]